jgi:mannose-6-phosphate isomerase-like protein (cupin superfamily)
MIGWVGNIELATEDNTNFRTVAFTGVHEQLTLMCIEPGQDIGREMHPHVDQFLRVEAGRGRVEFGAAEGKVDETYDVEDGWAIVVPAGVWHDLVNTGTEPLKLYSLYAPPNHPAGTVHRTKEEAELAEAAAH